MSRQQTELIRPVRFRDELYAEESVHGGPPDQGGEGMLHLKDLIPRLLVRWHWIALGLFLGIGIGLFQIWRAVPRYEAKATVLVRDYNVNAMGNLEAAEFDLRNMQAIETVRAQLQTYELAELVANDHEVRELKGLIPPEPKGIPFLSGSKEDTAANADRPPPEPAQLANMFQRWMAVDVRRESRLIDVRIQHPEPHVAQVLAGEFVEHYIERRSASRSEDQTGDYEYLTAESERIKKLLQEAENTLASYTAPLEAEKALAAAESNVDTLALRYRHKHPSMIEAQGRLAQAQENLRELLGRAARNSFDSDYWLQHANLTENLEDEDKLNEVRDLLIARRSVLESEISSQSTHFQTIVTKLQEKSVVKEKVEAEVSLMEAARLTQSDPVYPQTARTLATATALGLFAGLGLAFLFHFLDNKFHTVADVEGQLGLPVLAAVVDFDADEEAVKTKNEAPKKAVLTAYAPGRENWDPHMVFREESANSHRAEMFRVLRTAISLLGPADQRKITMITSALPAEGKTMIAANLAVALAQQGLRTLLIDLDLRKPATHKAFGMARDDHPGVVELLSGNAGLEHVVRTETGQHNLTLILSGTKAPNPGELLETGRIETLLKLFRQHFDHIVLDTAPLLAVPDSRLIAPLADNLALVVRAEATPRGAVKRAVQILDDFDVRPEGVVFNGYQERRSFIGKNYSYGYYKYGKYGYGKYQYGSYGSVYGADED